MTHSQLITISPLPNFVVRLHLLARRPESSWTFIKEKEREKEGKKINYTLIYQPPNCFMTLDLRPDPEFFLVTGIIASAQIRLSRTVRPQKLPMAILDLLPLPANSFVFRACFLAWIKSFLRWIIRAGHIFSKKKGTFIIHHSVINFHGWVSTSPDYFFFFVCQKVFNS